MPLKPVQVYAGGPISWIWMRERAFFMFPPFFVVQNVVPVYNRRQVTIQQFQFQFQFRFRFVTGFD
jgi:hypothetical protein